MKVPKVILNRKDNYILLYKYDEASPEIKGNDFDLVYNLKVAIPIEKIESLPNFTSIMVYNRTELLTNYNTDDDVANMTGLKWGDLRKELANPLIRPHTVNLGKPIETVMKDERTGTRVIINEEYYNLLLSIVDTLYSKYVNCKSMVTHVYLIKRLCSSKLLFYFDQKVIDSMMETLSIYIKLLEDFGVKIVESHMRLFDHPHQEISLCHFADTLGLLLTLEMESLSNLEVDDNESDIIDKIKCLFMSVYAFAFGILARGIIGQGE